MTFLDRESCRELARGAFDRGDLFILAARHSARCIADISLLRAASRGYTYRNFFNSIQRA